MYGGSTGPWSMSYDPALAKQPGILFSTLVRDLTPIRQALIPCACPIGNGLFRPIICAILGTCCDHIRATGSATICAGF